MTGKGDVMKKKTPITISELDVQPISDEDLRSFEAFGAQEELGSEIWCCNDSETITIIYCRAQ
jgi:hypothetical protein